MSQTPYSSAPSVAPRARTAQIPSAAPAPLSQAPSTVQGVAVPQLADPRLYGTPESMAPLALDARALDASAREAFDSELFGNSRGQARRRFQATVLWGCLAAGIAVTLYRNDLLLAGAQYIKQAPRYLELEQRLLGGAPSGTPRDVQSLINGSVAANAATGPNAPLTTAGGSLGSGTLGAGALGSTGGSAGSGTVPAGASSASSNGGGSSSGATAATLAGGVAEAAAPAAGPSSVALPSVALPSAGSAGAKSANASPHRAELAAQAEPKDTDSTALAPSPKSESGGWRRQSSAARRPAKDTTQEESPKAESSDDFEPKQSKRAKKQKDEAEASKPEAPMPAPGTEDFLRASMRNAVAQGEARKSTEKNEKKRKKSSSYDPLNGEL